MSEERPMGEDAVGDGKAEYERKRQEAPYTECVHGVSLDERCWQCMDDPRAGDVGRRVR